MLNQIDTFATETVNFEDDWSSFEPKEALAWTVFAFVAGVLAAWVGAFAWFALRFVLA